MIAAAAAQAQENAWAEVVVIFLILAFLAFLAWIYNR